jgi:hypothetical protein
MEPRANAKFLKANPLWVRSGVRLRSVGAVPTYNVRVEVAHVVQWLEPRRKGRMVESHSCSTCTWVLVPLMNRINIGPVTQLVWHVKEPYC